MSLLTYTLRPPWPWRAATTPCSHAWTRSRQRDGPSFASGKGRTAPVGHLLGRGASCRKDTQAPRSEKNTPETRARDEIRLWAQPTAPRPPGSAVRPLDHRSRLRVDCHRIRTLPCPMRSEPTTRFGAAVHIGCGVPCPGRCGAANRAAGPLPCCSIPLLFGPRETGLSVSVLFGTGDRQTALRQHPRARCDGMPTCVGGQCRRLWRERPQSRLFAVDEPVHVRTSPCSLFLAGTGCRLQP